MDFLEIRDGYRYQVFTTNAPGGQLPFLDARHRAHARVEDRIRTGKDTGIGHLPCRHTHINQVWIELALIASDLLALTQTMLVTDEPDLHRAEPKTLRYRLLHIAARITRGQRKVFLRLAEHWPLGTRPGQSVHPPTADPPPGLTASTTAPQPPQRSRRPRIPCRHLRLPDPEIPDLQNHQPTIKGLLKGRG